MAEVAPLLDGEIKFRQDNDWAVNFGGADGTLVDGGDNFVVTAGLYRVMFNTNDSTHIS